MGNSDRNIVLIGMTGCGKTTIGEIVADKLKYKVIDMDQYIQEISGKSIKELFEVGEEHFRTWESKACELLSKKNRTIISTGGGVIKKSNNMSLFKDNSIIIFIDRHVEDIIKDIDVEKRPLLANGKEVLYKLKDERYELYKKYCDYRVENVGSIDVVVDKIIDIIK